MLNTVTHFWEPLQRMSANSGIFPQAGMLSRRVTFHVLTGELGDSRYSCSTRALGTRRSRIALREWLSPGVVKSVILNKTSPAQTQ